MTHRRRTLISVLVIAVIGVPLPGAWLWLRTSRAREAGVIEVRGLHDYVRIDRDSLGVPHVWAASEADLLFAQGFLHAQDRLWQMELFRRVADGRLAEVLGEAGLESDRFLRVVGLGRAAAAQETRIDPATRSRLEAYAAGVNAFITTHRGALPPEFAALRFEPEPWTPRNTISVEKVMSWDLAPYGYSVQATRVARQLGLERAARLMPAYPEWGPTIIEMPALPEPPATAAELLGALSMTHASNAWVIAGSRTRSGKPILANDMHLALRVPAIWYLMALHGGGLDVAGMSIPGAPYIVAGHNRAIAWGFSNAMLDDLDLFVERLDPADSLHYLTAAGSEPFSVLHDTIRVKGRADPVLLDIRVTRHGPVLEDVEDPQARGPIAIMFAGRLPSHTLEALRLFNGAAGWRDFVRAVASFDNPHQNVVYADTAGNIGYIMGGRIPIRGDGRVPPVLPVPGWTGEWDWTGFVPFDDHPAVLNPPAGFIVTANNRQSAGAEAERISTSWEPPFRAARIRAMILEAKDIDAAAVHHMQLDVRDGLAERYRDRATQAARRAGLDVTADTLDAWDLHASRDSRGAALFYAWYESLASLAGHETFRDGRSSLPRSALDAILDGGPVPWESPIAIDEMAAAAAKTADSIAAGRTWGDIHRVVARHALSGSKLLDNLFGLDIGDVPGDGSPTTVNVSLYGGSLPVTAAYGPSERHVVDMARIDDAGGFILPTGQSGNPLDRHYRDQWPMWLDGGLWRIPLDYGTATARAVHTLRLQPPGR